jgi:hypothetical protein
VRRALLTCRCTTWTRKCLTRVAAKSPRCEEEEEEEEQEQEQEQAGMRRGLSVVLPRLDFALAQLYHGGGLTLRRSRLRCCLLLLQYL